MGLYEKISYPEKNERTNDQMRSALLVALGVDGCWALFKRLV